jgi:hypothetical protein
MTTHNISGVCAACGTTSDQRSDEQEAAHESGLAAQRDADWKAQRLVRVTAHGEAEGAADYKDRQSDVAAGQQDPTWAWPFQGADEAYVNAVGIDAIVTACGADSWNEIASDWFDAFERGYRAARSSGHAPSCIRFSGYAGTENDCSCGKA